MISQTTAQDWRKKDNNRNKQKFMSAGQENFCCGSCLFYANPNNHLTYKPTVSLLSMVRHSLEDQKCKVIIDHVPSQLCGVTHKYPLFWPSYFNLYFNDSSLNKVLYYACVTCGDIRPDCHHHFDASGTSDAMFDELAERSHESRTGTKHAYNHPL